ncbi:MAG: phosphoribosylformylglycinamidine synthase subunit PurQ [Clostridia bacterium]|nr:phosphoribosylformylglycinamidine synthase subunit PurQ [Clostridia bacterium]
MRFGVVVFPGSNCDRDCLTAISAAGYDGEFIWHRETSVDGFDCLVLPGGFAHGDYLRSGAIARFSPVMDSIIRYANEGKPVLGICNGFQVLLEAGLLPGAMLRNTCTRFVCAPQRIRVESARTPFTSGLSVGETLALTIAHGEGNYYADDAVLASLEAAGQVVFRYCDEAGNVTPGSNPNGSLNNIAGICNKGGNVLGMMPHPERAAEEILGGADGRALFESVAAWVSGGGRRG